MILQQRDFVSMVSHEFRGLLALIDANAQRMISLRERLSADELAARAGRIRDAVRHMTQLIDNLAGPARVGDAQGNVHFHEEPVDVTTILGEICQLQRDLSPECLIREAAGTHPIIVQGDATLLRQTFGNILANAVKYTPPQTWVDVRVTATQDEAIIVIEDHGIGIPPEDLPRIFEHSFRASNTVGTAGSGVGLYVAKNLIELHGGTIGVTSREGSGSRFEVQLPLGRRP